MTEDEKRRKLDSLMRGFESAGKIFEEVKGAVSQGWSGIAPSAMTKIQVILLFNKMERLNSTEKENVKNAVREEYCKIFSAVPNNVEMILCDGVGGMKAKYDVLLDISGGERVLNEGFLLDSLRNTVAVRLWKIFPKQMGFTGKVGTRTGDPLSAPKPAKNPANKNSDDDEPTRVYTAEYSNETFSRVILPQETLDDIERACKKIQLEREVFEEWGLYAIQPNPVCALNFYGLPGTGKTLAANALANKLNKKIIRASYADIESKYHGEGPKNVQAIFKAASEQDAILFIDEADSLLSKRLTNVTQGSEQAINSMRSQILICLEAFHGIVIFASNLIVNYDRAFLSRLTSVEFKLPDEKTREKIWRVHLLPTSGAKVQLKIPLADDVDFAALAKDFELNGRTIRNVVIEACVEARSKGMSELPQDVIISAIKIVVEREKRLADAKDHTALKSTPNPLAEFLRKKAETAETVTLSELESKNDESVDEKIADDTKTLDLADKT